MTSARMRRSLKCAREVRVLLCGVRPNRDFAAARVTRVWARGMALHSSIEMNPGDVFFADLRFENAELVLNKVLRCDGWAQGGSSIEAELAAADPARGEQIFRLVLAS